MPSVGQGNEKVSFPYDEEGIKAAEKYAQAVGGQVDYSEQASKEKYAQGMRSNISLGYAEGGKVPMSNGASRSVQTYPGGGKTGYNIMDKYEAGGAVKKAVKKAKKTKPKQKLEKKDNRGITGEYGSVLDEGGYETEVKSQKTRKFLKAMDKAYKKGKKSKQYKKK